MIEYCLITFETGLVNLYTLSNFSFIVTVQDHIPSNSKPDTPASYFTSNLPSLYILCMVSKRTVALNLYSLAKKQLFVISTMNFNT